MNGTHLEPIKVQDGFVSDVICFSPQRWQGLNQRTQHTLNRMAEIYRVFLFEEPSFHQTSLPELRITQEKSGPYLVSPYLPIGTVLANQENMLKSLLDDMVLSFGLERVMNWYLTPSAVKIAKHLRPIVSVYEALEMSPTTANLGRYDLETLEPELLTIVDVVFIQAHSKFNEKRLMHRNVYLFPDEATPKTTKIPADDRQLMSIRFWEKSFNEMLELTKQAYIDRQLRIAQRAFSAIANSQPIVSAAQIRARGKMGLAMGG